MQIELPNRIQDTIANFTGRSWLLPVLLEWLEQPDERMFILTGEPGTGKSCLMAWLAGAGPLPVEAEARAQLKQFRTAVKACHFCVAESGNTAPKAFARNLAEQLTGNVEGFSEALTETLADQVQISSTQNINTVATGGSVTGVYIEHLNLGNLNEELSFNRVLREPLRKLYEKGYNQPLLLLVDALDEAATYTGQINIIRLLAKLTDLPEQIRFLVTTRPDPRVLKYYHRFTPFDLLEDAPDEVDDIVRYANGLLTEPENKSRIQLATRISQAAEGNFLYAHLVLQDLLAQAETHPDLSTIALPHGLSGLYRDFLNRELGGDDDRWHKTFKPLLGLISVAQGQGLTTEQLEEISETGVEHALQICKQYLDGSLPDGPFRPFHKSFADFLLRDKENKTYHIDAADLHQQIVTFYLENYEEDWEDYDSYGLRYIATHLAEAAHAKSKVKRQQRTENLVHLVLNPDFQQTHLNTFNDVFAFQQDLERVLKIATTNPHSKAPALVVEAASGLLRFRRQQLRPEPIFELARRGEVAAAKRRLLLFPMEPQWRKAALLTIAWLADETNHDAACELQQQVGNESLEPWPLYRLIERLDSALNDSPLPPLEPPLPPAPDAEAIQNIVEHIGGLKGTLNPEFISGVQFNEAIMEATSSSDNQELVFVASIEGPLLVAYADESPDEGSKYFEQYLNIHAANNYVHYRNLSLWILLDAVLRHPDQDWTRRMVEKLLAVAFTGDTLAFQEGLSYTITALQALAGDKSKVARLEAHQTQTYTEITQLIPRGTYDGSDASHGKSDSWGLHKRCLAALAEAFTLLPEKSDQITDLLNRVRDIPRGFAGYESSTWLTLAETFRICQAPETDVISYALDKAEESAHNIQDSVFCARSTARVTAMKEKWRNSSPEQVDIRTLVADFVQIPDAPEFAALHRIGETYDKRDTTEGKLSLAYDLLEGKSLRQLAQAYRYPLSEFLRLNQEQNWGADDLLPDEILVNVPDPDFAPLIAARFSAEILVFPDLSKKERIQLIQLLVSIAVQNPTALDTVLSRLLLAAQPSDELILNELKTVVSHTKYRRFPPVKG